LSFQKVLVWSNSNKKNHNSTFLVVLILRPLGPLAHSSSPKDFSIFEHPSGPH